MECSDPKCRENLLYSINKKVNKTVLISVMIGLFGLIGTFSVYGLAADAKQKEKVVKNTTDIAVIQVKIDNIEETVERIENKQMSKQDILDAVKEALRHED